METVWNGILTCDYERTRPDAGLLSWDLYTTSLTRWPVVLMNEPTPYGRLRRPGIVDIDLADHERLTARWHTLLTDPAFVDTLIAATALDRHTTTRALDTAAAAHSTDDTTTLSAALATATTALVRVSSTHIVNWLLPENDWQAFLTRLFGNHENAKACVIALQFPHEPGHILAAHTRRTATGEGSHEVATSSAIATTSRERAATSRDAWRLAALTAATNSAERAQVRALTAVLGWAATCEERRNELRTRYLDLVNHWCTATGHDPRLVTTRQLLIGAADT